MSKRANEPSGTAMRGLVTDLPPAASWNFGGHPYGLEPLFLPAGPGPDEPRPEIDDGLMGRTRVLLDGDATGAHSLLAPEPVERRYWFRWITGHQTTFILWRLLAGAMTDLAEPQSWRAAADRASRFVAGYSGMLLYTSSCPRDVYQRVIRPSMGLVHPAFSGTWAPDFVAVRSLLRGRLSTSWRPDMLRSPELTALIEASAFSRRVHEWVAQKLVPGAASLLQTAGGPRRDWRPDVLAALYDGYFLTARSPVPLTAVGLQLVRRLRAIQLDLAANESYPQGGTEEPPPPEVREFIRGLPALLSDLAADAIAQTHAGAPDAAIPLEVSG